MISGKLATQIVGKPLHGFYRRRRRYLTGTGLTASLDIRATLLLTHTWARWSNTGQPKERCRFCPDTIISCIRGLAAAFDEKPSVARTTVPANHYGLI